MTESRREGPGLVGKIQTVLGPIPSERLGVTTTHEHLLVDLSALQKPPVEASRRATFYAPVTMELLGSINFGGQTNLDNSRLLDVETAIAETLLYKRAGGDTIVEATSIGIGRDPEGLRQIAAGHGPEHRHGRLVLRGDRAPRRHGRAVGGRHRGRDRARHHRGRRAVPGCGRA